MLDFDIIESEYGNLHQLIFDDSPIAVVTFEIRAKENIVVGVTTHAKNDDIFATVSTGEDGKLMDMPPLFLGKYEVVELSASHVYIIDKTPIPFEFTYQGQQIEFTSQNAIVKNDFQTLKLKVFKNEETIIKWKDNQPVISEIKANNKVFGLYSNQDFDLGDKFLEKDNLLAYCTVKNGELDINIQLPNGQYYFKELDSGAFHDINTSRYEFEFISEDNNATREILIQADVVPILNKLHFNRFSIR
ncbi:prealbumin-like fold domain-containing protein [Mycoplasma sp. P36-A1]|uniref:prealbumin-like fold domain-containing protein n=1 Tax=Mycoplasma sp. P36-A1 TaxID=3252900 RepID=UPI003C2CF551